MNFKPFSSFQQRRDFLKSASAMTAAGVLPTLDALNNVAHAAGGIDPTEVAADYKAIVCVFFYGGQDHSNILIPYQDGNAAGTGTDTNAQTEFDRYAKARSNFSTANPTGDPSTQAQGTGNLAYTRAKLANTVLPASTSNTVTTPGGWTNNTHGRQFALHPDYVELKALYDTGKLAVIANVGSLIAPISRTQWYGPSATRPATPVGLYSHDDQQKAWMSGTADIANPSVGVGGRIANNPAIVALNLNAQVSTQISTDGSNTFMLTALNPSPTAIAYQLGTGSIGRIRNGGTVNTGTNYVSGTDCYTSSQTNGAAFLSANLASPYCVRGGPISVNNGYSGNAVLKPAFLSRINAVSENSSIYSDQWRQTMQQSINTEAVISAAFINSPPSEDIVEPFVSVVGSGNTYNYLAAQLRMVAAMIRASNQLGASGGPMKRQIFFVGIGGFDTHDNQFWNNNPKNNSQISKAVNAFWTAMGRVKIAGAAPGSTGSAQDKVTLFSMSDFGRTLDSNGEGSDHGWGSHQFVLGGAVRGGIYGQNHNVGAQPAGTSSVPAFLQEDSTAGAVPRIGLPPSPYSGTTRISDKLNHALSRGELLPTTSSDAVVATIAKWFGVPAADLNNVFPKVAQAHPNGYDIGFMS
jgi:uncharacterized protein (DUF1501 family)